MADEVEVKTVPTVEDNGTSPSADVVDVGAGGEEEEAEPKPWEELTYEEALGRRPEWNEAAEEAKSGHAAEKRLEWHEELSPQLAAIQEEHKARGKALNDAATAWNDIAVAINEDRDFVRLEAERRFNPTETARQFQAVLEAAA